MRVNQMIQTEEYNEVNNGIDILTFNFKDKLYFTWIWFWRTSVIASLATLVSLSIAFIISGIITTFMLISSIDPNQYKFVLQVVGGFIGIIVYFLSVFPLAIWLTKRKIGQYKILIVSVENSSLPFRSNNDYEIPKRGDEK